MAPASKREHSIHPKLEDLITNAANFMLRIAFRAGPFTFDTSGKA